MPMIAAIGRQAELLDLVAGESARLLRRLDQHGARPNTIHLNITACDLRRAGAVQQLLRACFAYGVGPHRLVAEVTEQDLVELDDRVDANLTDLLHAGIQLAVDDFGTGYSSLSHLIDLPTAHVKIDRRFVTHLVEDRSLRALVSGLLGMANGLGIQTVAEGVETEAQAELLTSMGCGQLQGHLIAPALHPVDAVALALDAHNLQPRLAAPATTPARASSSLLSGR
jgi:EAL domain-containing protein (putative c-di-GMP-specific phosphodiesterase class I)